MSSKNYEKKCARLVQEACDVAYMAALRLVREHKADHPEIMPVEARALAIVDSRDSRPSEPSVYTVRDPMVKR